MAGAGAKLSGRLRIRIRVFKIPEPEPTHEGSARPHALSVWYGDFAQSITEFGVNLQYVMRNTVRSKQDFRNNKN